MTIRYPTETTYDVVFVNGDYRIKCKDGIHDATIRFVSSEKRRSFFLFDGIVYRRISTRSCGQAAGRWS